MVGAATVHTVVAGARYLADVTVSSSGISGWLKDNALPLIILIIGLSLLGASRKGDTSKVVLTIGLVIMSLAVVTIGLDSTLGLGIGRWVLSLLGVQGGGAPTAPTGVTPPATAAPTTGG